MDGSVGIECCRKPRAAADGSLNRPARRTDDGAGEAMAHAAAIAPAGPAPIFSEDAARINPWPKITGLAAAASARCRLLFSR
jgi:hypothetical protein